MENERQIKNTAPAVMEDIGPRGSTRKKSKDGRYTASEIENEYPKDDPRHHEQRYNNGEKGKEILNDHVYEPLFIRSITGNLLKDLQELAQPGQEAFLIKSNSDNDSYLGIDYQLGIRTKGEGFVSFDPLKKYDVDLKVINSFGDEERYKKPKISLTLYKFDHENRTWKEGSFLNRHHINDTYTFIIPKCDENKNSIIQNLRRDPSYMPNITEAKVITTPKKSFKPYVEDRMLKNQNMKDLIDWFKINDIQKIRNPKTNVLYEHMTEDPRSATFKINFPVPGETFEALLELRTDNDGHKEIRLHIPTSMFHSGSSVRSRRNLVRFDRWQ